MTKKEMINEMVKNGWIKEEKRNRFMHHDKRFVTYFYNEMIKTKES